jgi:hypothetical protein
MGVVIDERNKMKKELVFTFQPQKKDYIKASRTLALKTPSFMIIGILILLVVIASVVVLIVPTIGNPTWRSAAFVGLAMGAFYIINFWLIIPYQLSNAFKRNENLRLERTLSVSDAGVAMQVGERSTQFSWENFQMVISSDGFYLMIYKADERIYPFIPKRAFEGATTKGDFLAVLEDKMIPVR